MKKQKNDQNTAKETDFPVCRFSTEDCALLKSVGIDPMGDVPDEVVELVRKGVPVLCEKSETEPATESDGTVLKKYLLPLESLSRRFPVRITDELRCPESENVRYCHPAVFVRKDSARQITVENNGDTFCLLPSGAAAFFARMAESCDEADSAYGLDGFTLHLFHENADGSVDYAEPKFYAGGIRNQTAWKKALPANVPSDDVFVIPLHFPEYVCPICGKRTVSEDSFGGEICPVCGWCELRAEDGMSEFSRRKKYEEQLALDPNFMYFDPIEGNGFLCPVTRKKENCSGGCCERCTEEDRKEMRARDGGD